MENLLALKVIKRVCLIAERKSDWNSQVTLLKNEKKRNVKSDLCFIKKLIFVEININVISYVWLKIV